MEIIVITLLAFFLSIVLVTTDHFLNHKNRKLEQIRELLPGYNCGTCGYVGCDGMALAIQENPLSYQKCRPLKENARLEMEAYLRKQKKLIETQKGDSYNEN